MAGHGFSEKKIYESFEKFHKETKAEREKYETLAKFNEAILKSDKKDPLGQICKGINVGNIFIKSARDKQHRYLLASSEMFIIVVPFGPIQSIIHMMAIPKVPMYNAVSLGVDSVLLLQKMQAALVQVVTDVLIPDSIPQQLYLRALSEGIDQTNFSSIKITQAEKNLDTSTMSGAQACEMLRGRLKEYHDMKKKRGVPLTELVSTDLHLHDTNSVGQLHMHGWIAEPGMITDNGKKIEYKNTPLDRIVPLLVEFRGAKLHEKSKISVVVENAAAL